MWPKDDYQEQMLGYLAGTQTEIERLARLRSPRPDVAELYADFDLASARLWQLIETPDRDWEGCRAALEVDCALLLRVLSHPPVSWGVIRSRAGQSGTQRNRERVNVHDGEPAAQPALPY
jgi:hypothetical protein